MNYHQNLYREGQWTNPLPKANKSDLVLLFGDRSLAQDKVINNELRASFPHAEIVGCTTSGEICDTEIHDDSLSLCALEFSGGSYIRITTFDSTDIAPTEELLANLPTDDLQYVFVLSDGQKVNGSSLISTLTEVLPSHIPISGGLAGDGSRFSETMLWHNGIAKSGGLILVGFYGENLKISHGSVGGWDPFGPVRTVTRAKENVVYEFDEKPALDLYKRYLGHHSEQLPSSALLFPLALVGNEGKPDVIRTILQVDEEEQSMTFAGDVPKGSKTQLMRANFDRLLDGSGEAAQSALTRMPQTSPPGIAILISCVGRRLVLKTRSEEELEAIRDHVPEPWALCGFYSYGEISPFNDGSGCSLHNQTMTVTLISENDE